MRLTRFNLNQLKKMVDTLLENGVVFVDIEAIKETNTIKILPREETIEPKIDTNNYKNVNIADIT